MQKKALFDKISSVECSLDEIKEAVRVIKSDGVGTKTPFRDYYRIEAHLKCIELYEHGFATAEFVSKWAYAYGYLVTDGFKNYESNGAQDTVTLKDVLHWELCDWLDALSFFKYGESDTAIKKHKKTVSRLYAIYTRPEAWKVYYSHDHELLDDATPTGAAYVLLVNEGKKKYIQMLSEAVDFLECSFIGATLTDDVDDVIKELASSGYSELF